MRGIGGNLGGSGAPAYGGTEPTYLNGSRYFARLEFNPYLVDHIDVLKGPASVLYGQANPGGIINMVTKAPTGSGESEIVLKTGSGQRKEIGIDLDRSTGTGLDWRLVAAAKDVHWRAGDNAQQRAFSVAPSVRWRNGSTTVLLSALYENQPKAGERNFLPRRGTVDAYSDGTRIARNFYAGEPGFHDEHNSKARIGWDVTHRVSDALTLSQHGAYGRYSNYMGLLAALEGAPWTADSAWGPGSRTQAINNGLLGDGERDIYRESTVWDYHWREFQIDNRATFKFSTGDMQHTLLAGVDYYSGRQHVNKWENTTQPGINSANPVYGVSILPHAQSANERSTIGQLGLYVSDQMRLGDMHLQLGVRYDRARTTLTDPLAYNLQNQSQRDAKLTWRAGALYELPGGISPYVSYSTAFVPAVGVDNDGRAYKPATARQAEVGLKYQPHSNLLLTASAFDIRQRNLATYVYDIQRQNPDGSWTSGYIQTGESRVRGFELELQGDITPSWGVSGSYTHLRQRIVRDDSGLTTGNTHWGLPRHSVSLWSDWRVQDGPLRGASLGVGVRHTGKTWGNNQNTFRVPGFTLWDLKLAYLLDQWLPGASVQLNVQNVADKTYVASCAADFACFYGRGRRATLSLNYRW